MTFLEPVRLVLLAVPVLLGVAYLVVLRRRRRVAVRFTSVDLLASVMPRRSAWPRHIGPVLLLAALGGLVVGFARPVSEERVAKDQGTIMLVLDASASMGAEDVAPNRLAAARSAAARFVGELPRGIRMGVVSFDRSARVLVSPTDDREAVARSIESLQLGPGTATGEAVLLSLEALRIAAPDGKQGSAAVVLMSDGEPTVGRAGETPRETLDAAVSSAQAAGVAVTTIAFGTPDGFVVAQGRRVAVPADPDTMAEIATDTGGQTFTAETADQLASVYDSIGRSVAFELETTEHTAWWTGLGIVLVALAAGAGLVWSQKLV
ncbi:MAG: VWA domain-containing protein [Acidimicrobiales bacterium]